MDSKIEYGLVEMGGPRHLYRERLIINFVKEAKTKGLILDAGCGDGSLSLALAKYGFKVEAFDLASGCVAMLKEKARNADLNGRIKCYQGDIREIKFSAGIFDGIVCGEVLEHVQDDRKVVREFNRVLKLGGICVVTVPINPELWDLWDEMAGHIKRYKKQELIELFEGNGFKIEKLNFWGFPLMRFYHRTIFLLWAKITRFKKDSERNRCTLTKIGKNTLVSSLIANIFKVDNLFSRLPWGIGAILCAKKVENLKMNEG